MRAAGTDPGAVHYHFGGREQLAAAVLESDPLHRSTRARLLLLGEAVERGRPTVPELVYALIRPDVDAAHALHARSFGRARLIGAIYTRPGEFVAATVARHFAPVAGAFGPHLEAALPHLSFADIAWRIRWGVFGTVGAILTDESAAFERPADELTAELVRTQAAMLSA